LEIDNNQNLHLGPIVPLKNIMVDGLGIGDVGKVVLRDRQVMAEEGMLVVIVPLEVQTGKLSGNIEIISRGVVYMKQSKQLLDKLKNQVQQAVAEVTPPVTDWNSTKEKIRTRLESFLSDELERFPIIIPILIRT